MCLLPNGILILSEGTNIIKFCNNAMKHILIGEQQNCLRNDNESSSELFANTERQIRIEAEDFEGTVVIYIHIHIYIYIY